MPLEDEAAWQAYLEHVAMRPMHPLLVTRGLDPRVYLPLPTLPRERGRVGRGLDCRISPGNDVG